MKVYQVKLWYTTHVTRTIEAVSEEDAIERCVMNGLNFAQLREAIDKLKPMEFNNEVTLVRDLGEFPVSEEELKEGGGND